MIENSPLAYSNKIRRRCRLGGDEAARVVNPRRWGVTLCYNYSTRRRFPRFSWIASATKPLVIRNEVSLKYVTGIVLVLWTSSLATAFAQIRGPGIPDPVADRGRAALGIDVERHRRPDYVQFSAPARRHKWRCQRLGDRLTWPWMFLGFSRPRM